MYRLKAEAMAAAYIGLRYGSVGQCGNFYHLINSDYSQVIEKHVEQDIEQCDESVTCYYWTTRMSIGPA